MTTRCSRRVARWRARVRRRPSTPTGWRRFWAGLAAGDRPVAVPVFDRSLEISRAAARIIDPEVRLILVEGNYLLLDDPDWERLRPCFDLTLFVEVPVALLEQRLRARWDGLAPGAAEAKIAGNDLPNARLVVERSVPADMVLKT